MLLMEHCTLKPCTPEVSADPDLGFRAVGGLGMGFCKAGQCPAQQLAPQTASGFRGRHAHRLVLAWMWRPRVHEPELARSILATPTGREGCFSPNRCRAPAMGSLRAANAAAAGGLAVVALDPTCSPCIKTALLRQACSGQQVVQGHGEPGLLPLLLYLSHQADPPVHQLPPLLLQPAVKKQARHANMLVLQLLAAVLLWEQTLDEEKGAPVSPGWLKSHGGGRSPPEQQCQGIFVSQGSQQLYLLVLQVKEEVIVKVFGGLYVHSSFVTLAAKTQQ
ncbi:MAG: hypothetical protein FRX49_04467 [Trebouxia sp. A1-2]|nr:MAG: hypothetical protein FRX49_04467 [Trebouxia sp. A1-2]